MAGSRKASSTVESASKRKARATRILDILEKTYPDARCALDFQSPFQLLVATILSAQSTDRTINRITPALFQEAPGPMEMVALPLERLEDLIHASGFFRVKARHISQTSRLLLEQHGGEVPRTMDELVKLPGVARKTASVVLFNAFGINQGIAVDTHVLRLSYLLNLSSARNAVSVERDLARLFPQERWGMVTHLIISHGRAVCIARRPRCGSCVLAIGELCPSASVR